jgi:hypothetical protein
LILNSELLECDEEYVNKVISYDGKISTSGGIQRSIFIDRSVQVLLGHSQKSSTNELKVEKHPDKTFIGRSLKASTF